MPPEPGTPAFYNEKLESIIAEDRALRRQRRDTPRELDFGAYDDPPRRAMAGEEGASVAAAAAALIQFQMVSVQTPANTFRVVAGSINGLIPTGMNYGDNPIFTKTVSGSGVAFAKIKVRLVDLVYISVEIFTGVNIDPDTDDGTYAYGNLAIGTYNATGGELFISGHGLGNQQHMYCGGRHLFWLA